MGPPGAVTGSQGAIRCGTGAGYRLSLALPLPLRCNTISPSVQGDWTRSPIAQLVRALH